MAAFSLKATSKGVTGLVITAAVILFGCVLAYVGVAGKVKTLTKEMRAKEKQVVESRQIAQKLERSKLDYFDARSQVRCLEASVSTQEYVPTLLKQLERLGESVDLKVLGVRPAPESTKPAVTRSLSSGRSASEGNIEKASDTKPNPQAGERKATRPSPYDQLEIDVEGQGHYMSALDFLYRLTSFPKIIAVNEVEMTPPGTASRTTIVSTPTLKIKLKITAFVLKDDTKGPRVPKSADPQISASSCGWPATQAGTQTRTPEHPSTRKGVADSDAG